MSNLTTYHVLGAFTSGNWSFPMADRLRVVLGAKNWKSLHPDKVWRPLIRLQVDGRPTGDVRLGVDGQNPNQQTPLILYVYPWISGPAFISRELVGITFPMRPL